MLISNPSRFTRLGTPGNLLLKAGLFAIDGDELAATDLLVSWFPAGLPDLGPVADALEALVVSMAYDRSGFLDGSTLAIRAIGSLRALGVSTMVDIRGPLEQAAEEVAAELEQAKMAIR